MKKEKEKTISIDRDVHKKIKTISTEKEIHLKTFVSMLVDMYEYNQNITPNGFISTSLYNIIKKENEDLKKQITVMQSEYVKAWEKIQKLEGNNNVSLR